MSKNIKELNEELKKYADSNGSVRRSRVLTYGKPLYTSIVGELKECEVYGVLPTMSIDKIKEDLLRVKESPLLNKEDFHKYLEDNKEQWSWGNKRIKHSDETLRKALLGKCILSIMNQFSLNIKIKLNKDEVKKLILLLDKLKVFYELEDNKIDSNLRLCGRLTQKQIDELADKYYLTKSKNRKRIALRSNKENRDDINEEGINFNDLYMSLSCHHYLYSGVVTNLESITLMPLNEANINISQIKVDISKTTFATVVGLGHPQLSYDEGRLYKKYFLKEHPLLSDYLEILNNFDKSEAQQQEMFFKALNDLDLSDDKLVDEINSYLKASYYPHIISVAGNIVTSDKYNIYLKRGTRVESENKYSCAVTGYSEINDERVEFYKYSVEADKPSISNSGIFTFSEEFARETRAELSIATVSADWRYYGIIISGKERNIQYLNSSGLIQPLTVDFEVAAETNISSNLNEVVERQKNAIESDESEGIYGIKFNIYRGFKQSLFRRIRYLLNSINEYKEFIFILLIMMMSMKDIFKNEINLKQLLDSIFIDISNTVQWILNLILVILFVINLVEIIKENKIRESVSVNSRKFSLPKINKKIFKNSTYKRATYLSISMINLHAIALKDKE